MDIKMPLKTKLLIGGLIVVTVIMFWIAFSAGSQPKYQMQGMTECSVTYTATQKIVTCPR